MRHAMPLLLSVSFLLVGCQDVDTGTPAQSAQMATGRSGARHTRYATLAIWRRLEWDAKMLMEDVETHAHRRSVESLQPLEDRLQSAKLRLSHVEELLRERKTVGPKTIDSVSGQHLDTIRNELPYLLERLNEIELRLDHLAERRSADVARFESLREKYREHLLKGAAAEGIPDKALYADDAVVLYVQAYATSAQVLRVRLCIGLIEPRLSHEELSQRRGNPPRTWRADRAPISLLLHDDRYRRILVCDKMGTPIGSPVSASVSHGRPRSSNAAVVELVFENVTSLDKGPLEAVIEKDSFYNREEAHVYADIVKEPPQDMRYASAGAAAGSSTSTFMSRVAAIACKRTGSHLAVPVTLDIHGELVETELVLDTGASITVVPRSVYVRGNAKPIETLPRRRLLTVGGPVTAYIDQIGISTSAYSKETVIAISDTDARLLGANYFEGSVFTVDLDRESVYIHPKSP